MNLAKLAVAVVGALASSTMALAAPLDPLDFASLGTLNLAGGSFTIDTDALTIVDDAAPHRCSPAWRTTRTAPPTS